MSAQRRQIVILGGGTGGTMTANRSAGVRDIISVGEFYELAAGGQVIFT